MTHGLIFLTTSMICSDVHDSVDLGERSFSSELDSLLGTFFGVLISKDTEDDDVIPESDDLADSMELVMDFLSLGVFFSPLVFSFGLRVTLSGLFVCTFGLVNAVLDLVVFKFWVVFGKTGSKVMAGFVLLLLFFFTIGARVGIFVIFKCGGLNTAFVGAKE